MDEGRFTAFIAKAIEKLVPNSSVTINAPLQLTVDHDGGSWHADLHANYSYCKGNPSGCEHALLPGIERFAALLKSAPVLKSHLRIVVRNSAKVDALVQRYGEDTNALMEPISGDLWAITVEDRPRSVRYPKFAELIALGLPDDKGLKLARANTKSAAGARIPHLKPEEKTKLLVLFGDDFVTTFAFPELWAPVAHTFGGTLIVAVPSNDQMFAIGDDAPDALTLIRKTSADEWAHSGQPLSRSLFRWSEKGWIEIQPSPK
ncbi:MAG: DUF1444 domain-containing protein [Methylovirgula sp.]